MFEPYIVTTAFVSLILLFITLVVQRNLLLRENEELQKQIVKRILTTETSLENIHQYLLEQIGEIIEDAITQEELLLGELITKPFPETTDLHIKMARAAFVEMCDHFLGEDLPLDVKDKIQKVKIKAYGLSKE